MISIVMPFYKKYKEFFTAFEKINFYEFNKYLSLELIISVDDPTESEDLLSYIEKKASVDCHFSIKILLNSEKHEWRCPSKAINHGIKNASHEKIVVMSPETLALPNSFLSLQSHCTEKDFSLGIIKYADEAQIDFFDIKKSFEMVKRLPLPYGSICFTKQQAMSVGGYNENYTIWGGDDDDFRNRLVLAGYSRKVVLSKFLHLELLGRELNHSKDKKKESQYSEIFKKTKEISKTKNFKIISSLLSEEMIETVFEFKPT